MTIRRRYSFVVLLNLTIAVASLLTSTVPAAAAGIGLPVELTSGPGCFERAERSNARRLMGGFRSVRNPSRNEDVTQIVHAAMLRLNSLSGEHTNAYQLDVDTNGQNQVVAYRQLVNGLRYCVRFVVRNARCSHDANMCSDSDSPKTFSCDAASYRGFRDESFRPDVNGGLTCWL